MSKYVFINNADYRKDFAWLADSVIPVSTPFYKVIETIFLDNVIFFLVSPRALSSKIFVKETMKQYRYIFINIVGDGVVTSVAFMVICDL